MEEVKRTIRRNNIEFVRFEIEDLNCISKGFTLDVDFFLEICDQGIPYCLGGDSITATGNIVTGTGICSEIDYKNGYGHFDFNTFRILPWLENTASIFVDLKWEPGNENKSIPDILHCSTRAQCKKQIKNLEEFNMKLFSAFELEFYILEKETENCSQVYSTNDNEIYSKVMRTIMRSMKKVGIKPEVFHTELGRGQIEITQKPAFGTTSADNTFRFRNLVKETCQQHGKFATFMSKPILDQSGSSGHFNHSVWSLDGKNNLFFNPSNPNRLSEIGQQWLAGLQYHHEALAALALPTLNCYDRVKPENFAPVTNLWGYDNRTVCYRVKAITESSTYIENRLPGAAVNPYLLLAGNIIAGLDGIKKKLTLQTEPFKGDADINKENIPKSTKRAPESLSEALECLQNNEVFVKELGEDFVKCYTAVKRSEIEEVKATNTEERHSLYMTKLSRYI